MMGILAAFVAIMIHALLSALGRAFALRELQHYANAEMLQAGATMLMVIFLVFIVSEAQAFAISYFIGSGGGGSGQLLACGSEMVPVGNMTDALDLFKCRMQKNAQTFAILQEDVITSSGDALFLKSIYMSQFGLPTLQGGYFGEVYRQIEINRLLISLSTNMLIATNSMIVFADYVKNSMLGFFLPFGLILRSFHFTRGVGAFFIAMAIGFYFIFPIFYIITDPGYVKPSYDVPNSVPNEELFCYPTFTGIVRQLSDPETTYDLTRGSGGGGGGISIDTLRSDISKVYFAVILHPFVIFSITLVFVRQMMYVLGGDGQYLLRMVSKVI